jgi:RTX calcium-binding nonapeptide repeat (4 copies)
VPPSTIFIEDDVFERHLFRGGLPSRAFFKLWDIVNQNEIDAYIRRVTYNNICTYLDSAGPGTSRAFKNIFSEDTRSRGYRYADIIIVENIENLASSVEARHQVLSLEAFIVSWKSESQPEDPLELEAPPSLFEADEGIPIAGWGLAVLLIQFLSLRNFPFLERKGIAFLAYAESAIKDLLSPAEYAEANSLEGQFSTSFLSETTLSETFSIAALDNRTPSYNSLLGEVAAQNLSKKAVDSLPNEEVLPTVNYQESQVEEEAIKFEGPVNSVNVASSVDSESDSPARETSNYSNRTDTVGAVEVEAERNLTSSDSIEIPIISQAPLLAASFAESVEVPESPAAEALRIEDVPPAQAPSQQPEVEKPKAEDPTPSNIKPIYLDASGSQNVISISDYSLDVTISKFGGVGRGINPTAQILAELDTLKFEGDAFSVENLIINQRGGNAVINFYGLDKFSLTLEGLRLDEIDNIPFKAESSGYIGNILFNGETEVSDKFDVINREENLKKITAKNKSTILNELDNFVYGLDDSNDIIHGQDGNDTLIGKSGNDVFHGGNGDDLLEGGLGADRLYGGPGADRYALSLDSAYDTIMDFSVAEDYLVLPKGISVADVEIRYGSLGPEGESVAASINLRATNQTLAVLINVDAALIGQAQLLETH